MIDTSENMRSCVQRGAKLLDNVMPTWAADIAVDELAMESCDRCILGQLLGNYEGAWMAITRYLPATQLHYASFYGFTVEGWEQEQAIEDGVDAATCFAPLAAAWRKEINSRLATREVR